MEIVKITTIKPSEKNTRLVKEKKFKILVDSIKESPHFMKLRPVVVNENMEIIGGNMRYRACRELKWKEIPIDVYTRELHEEAMLEREEAERVTYEEGCDEFMIKDNTEVGQWDYSMLANDWSNEKIYKWGIPVWQEETTGFIPNYNPEAGDNVVTDKDIDRVKSAIDKKFEQHDHNTVEVMCPECAHKFTIRI